MTLAFYTAAELSLFLLCVSGFLLFRMRKLSQLLAALELKVQELRELIRTTKDKARELILEAREKAQSLDYLSFVEAEIDRTRDFHLSHSPDQDIVLDLDVNVPLERQVAALRHAFLVAEKEASYAGDGEDPEWDVLKLKFGQIINLYRHAFSAPAAAPVDDSDAEDTEPLPVDEQPGDIQQPEEAASEPVVEMEEQDSALVSELRARVAELEEDISNYIKRVENLDKFKKLFFDMEDKWLQARKEAEQYLQELRVLASGLDNSEDFDAVLDRYMESFHEVDELFRQEGSELATEVLGEKANVDVRVTNREEVSRLKKLMINQHNIIADLKQKLTVAKTAADKEVVIQGLQDELDKQGRFIKECETCIELLEDELSGARRENRGLEDEVESLRKQLSEQQDRPEAAEQDGLPPINASTPEVEQEVAELVSGYVAESRGMLSTIAFLEEELSKIREERKHSAAGNQAGAPAADASQGTNADATVLAEELERARTQADALRFELEGAQKELRELQAEHLKLEERYIELKSNSL